ncbi:MAG: hypothetical protein SOT80_04255 [Candidatus Pseudoruminococcus sp.]|nr:hypothetical protein [Ruminococcus sp.]MDY2782601.1 hypothetical protein [Candidatus Pseudoruminococcus sp.]
MKIKYNWIVLIITAVASLGLGVWRSVVINNGGEFFLDKSMYSIVIFGLIILGLIVGAVLTILDRETPQNYDIGKNFFAGFFGLLISICFITHGILGFMSISNVPEDNNVILYTITKLFELLAGGVFLMESVSSLIGRNLLKTKPLFTVIVPVMFALRLINLFFEYTKVSVQSSEMFDIVAVAIAALFIYYHAVMFAGLKKSCIKSLFLFGAPMICACFAYGADVVVSAIISGNFKIDDMIMKVSDILLCFYTISLLVEITSKAGKQYLHKQAEELEEAEKSEPNEKSDVPEEQAYSSFEDIASFGKSAPHIRRETILSEPAASVEPKQEEAGIASHADALHSVLQNSLEAQEPEVELPQAAEQEPEPEPIVKGNHVAEATTLTDSNPDIASEKIPAPSKSSYTPTTDGVDMDRINRLLSEFEKDK